MRAQPDPDDAGRPLADTREWLSFEVDDETVLFDLTWLRSRWRCLYGDGCPGIADRPAPEAEHGCCTHGAHFVTKQDRKATAARISALGEDEWQLRDAAESHDGAIVHDGGLGAWVTATHDGACILLNRTDWPGGAGCALHQAALRRGERPVDWKPTVCWQVPLRAEYHTDDNGHVTTMVREWRRRDWGDGGAEFHWWCTEAPEAFDAETPVFLSARDELVELVGRAAYDALVDHLGDTWDGSGHPG